MSYIRNLSLLSLLAIPFVAHAQVAFVGQNSPNNNMPLDMPAWSVVATGGDVTATIMPYGFNGSPGFYDELYAGPLGGAVTDLGNNHQFGASADLGPMTAGQEITLSMSTPQGFTYYSGSLAGMNVDGYNHTDVYNTTGGVIVDFEDLAQIPNVSGSDFNYGDASVFVSGAQAVPEPLPCVALGLGVLGLAIRRKRA